MCASCDAWCRERHDPEWKERKLNTKVKTMGHLLPNLGFRIKPRTP